MNQPSDTRVRCELATSEIDPAALLRDFSSAASGVGAITSFTGIARPNSKQGTRAKGLFLDHHERMTLASMEQIGADATERFDITHWQIAHRCGFVGAGEAIVFVAAASAHRRAAFQAADYMMDRLKTDAVFWKREDTDHGSEWIEPTAEDYAARDNW